MRSSQKSGKWTLWLILLCSITVPSWLNGLSIKWVTFTKWVTFQSFPTLALLLKNGLSIKWATLSCQPTPSRKMKKFQKYNKLYNNNFYFQFSDAKQQRRKFGDGFRRAGGPLQQSESTSERFSFNIIILHFWWTSNYFSLGSMKVF